LSRQGKPIYIKPDKVPIELQKDDLFEMHNGEVISLLEGQYKFRVKIQFDSFDSSKDTDEFGEPTQLDLGL